MEWVETARWWVWLRETRTWKVMIGCLHKKHALHKHFAICHMKSPVITPIRHRKSINGADCKCPWGIVGRNKVGIDRQHSFRTCAAYLLLVVVGRLGVLAETAGRPLNHLHSLLLSNPNQDYWNQMILHYILFLCALSLVKCAPAIGGRREFVEPKFLVARHPFTGQLYYTDLTKIKQPSPVRRLRIMMTGKTHVAWVSTFFYSFRFIQTYRF